MHTLTYCGHVVLVGFKNFIYDYVLYYHEMYNKKHNVLSTVPYMIK